jgi:hypothetical protein
MLQLQAAQTNIASSFSGGFSKPNRLQSSEEVASIDRLLMALTGLGIRDTVLFPLVK